MKTITKTNKNCSFANFAKAFAASAVKKIMTNLTARIAKNALMAQKKIWLYPLANFAKAFAASAVKTKYVLYNCITHNRLTLFILCPLSFVLYPLSLRQAGFILCPLSFFLYPLSLIQ